MVLPTTTLPMMNLPLGAPVMASGRLDLSTSSLDTFFSNAQDGSSFSDFMHNPMVQAGTAVGLSLMAAGGLWWGARALRAYLASRTADSLPVDETPVDETPVDVTDDVEFVPPPAETTPEPQPVAADDDKSTVRRDILAPQFALPTPKMPPEASIRNRLETVLRAEKNGEVGMVRVFLRRLNATKGSSLSEHKLEGKLLGLKDGKVVMAATNKREKYRIPLKMIEQVRYLRPDGTPDYDWNAEFIHPDASAEMRDMELYPASRAASDRQFLIDFSDPRLINFLRLQVLPIRRLLEAGTINRQEAVKRAWSMIRVMKLTDPKSVRKQKLHPSGLYRLGQFVEEGILDERAMLLQVALQYIGVPSLYQRAFIPLLGGRHAWVRVEIDGVHYIYDPAQPRAISRSPNGKNGQMDYQLYASAVPAAPVDANAAAFKLPLDEKLKRFMATENISEVNLRDMLARAAIPLAGTSISSDDLFTLAYKQASHVMYSVFGIEYYRTQLKMELSTVVKVWRSLDVEDRRAWWMLEGREADGGFPEIFLRRYLDIRQEGAKKDKRLPLTPTQEPDEESLHEFMLESMRDSMQSSDTLIMSVTRPSDPAPPPPPIERIVPLQPAAKQPIPLVRRREAGEASAEAEPPTQRATPRPRVEQPKEPAYAEVSDDEILEEPKPAPVRERRPPAPLPQKGAGETSPMESAIREVSRQTAEKPKRVTPPARKAQAKPRPKRLGELALKDLDMTTPVDHEGIQAKIDQMYEAERATDDPTKLAEAKRNYEANAAYYEKFVKGEAGTLGELISLIRKKIRDDELIGAVFRNFKTYHRGLNADRAAREFAIYLGAGLLELRREAQDRRKATVKMDVIDLTRPKPDDAGDELDNLSLAEQVAMFERVPESKKSADELVEAPVATEPWPPAPAEVATAPVEPTAVPARTARRRLRSFGDAPVATPATETPVPAKKTSRRRRRSFDDAPATPAAEPAQETARPYRRRLRSF